MKANSVNHDQTSAASDLGLHFCKCPFYGMLDFNWLIRGCFEDILHRYNSTPAPSTPIKKKKKKKEKKETVTLDAVFTVIIT